MMIVMGRSLLVAGLALAAPGLACADEVDDLLALRNRNQARVRHFAAEFLVETRQPKTVSNPKTVRMRYHLNATKAPALERRGKRQPWRVELEVLEPGKSKMRIEGDTMSYLDQSGNWRKLEVAPEVRAQFADLGDKVLGADAAIQREHFAIRVLRHNRPWFGEPTATLEYVPRESKAPFARREEDVNEDGLPVETRIVDEQGRTSASVKITRHTKLNGVPVMEVMEAVTQTPAGEVVSRTSCSRIQVDLEGGH